MKEKITWFIKIFMFALVLCIIVNSNYIGQLLQSEKGNFDELFLAEISIEDINGIVIYNDNDDTFSTLNNQENFNIFIDYLNSIEFKTKIPTNTGEDYNNIRIHIDYGRNNKSIRIYCYNKNLVRISKDGLSKDYILKQDLDFEYLLNFM